MLTACNQQTTRNGEKNQNSNSTPSSVFEDSPNDNPENLKHVTQKLVTPPSLPKYDQVASGDPVVVEVKFVIQEKKLQIFSDAKIWALTYNGSVPGPLIEVHKGDYVQLTLVNPATNTLMHNIDFHAATGALGGADLSKIAPGQ